MKNRYLILLAGLLVAGSLLLVACGDKNDKPADTQAPTAAQTTPATDPADETTAPADDTTVAEDETTVAEDDTTVAEDDTTVAEDDTTVAEDDTTVTEEETTVVDAIVNHVEYEAVYLNGNTATSIKPLENENGIPLILGLENTATSLELAGWVALAKENYTFAYAIDDGEAVTDPAFIVTAEQDVLNKIAEIGGVAGNRFAITVDITSLVGYHTIKALVEVDGEYHVMAECRFYKASAEESYTPPYGGFAETINGQGFAMGWDEVCGHRTVTENGLSANITEYSLTEAQIAPFNNQLILTGAAFVNGGQDKLFYSIDGENWIEIPEQTIQVHPYPEMALWYGLWALRGGLYDFADASFLYTATIDLSEYAGQTVDVRVGIRGTVEYNGVQPICHLFTLTDVVVEVAE